MTEQLTLHYIYLHTHTQYIYAKSLHIYMDHFIVHMKLTQHCKSIIRQLRQKLKRLAACPWRYCQYNPESLPTSPSQLPRACGVCWHLRGRKSVGFPPGSIQGGRFVHPWHKQEGCRLETTAFQLTAGKFALFL